MPSCSAGFSLRPVQYSLSRVPRCSSAACSEHVTQVPGTDCPVRIIAGTHRGQRIAAPKGRETRPTSDRVRENAFNLIGPVDDADVLDHFAGSGAMGLEALSRGAARATFVEQDRDACRVINANLDKLGLHATVLCQDVQRAVAVERRTYDLVLCDPPYEYDSS